MRIFDSKLRIKKEFVPLRNNEVSLYVCGITPNNATHLGHAFTYVMFDVLVRVLRYSNFRVQYIQNATDINDSDDVIRQAEEAGVGWEDIAKKWITHFKEMMERLNVTPPDHYVLASHMIPDIVDKVKILVHKNIAYENDGYVYFDTRRFDGYGTLSGFNESQMLTISRERGNDPDDPRKRNPLDFVLWVPSAGAPHWSTPWGNGRPGWHIECSAMAQRYLGDRIDIHGGGRDLIFPHHESEIAQTESVTGQKPFVNTWMHAGMVMYEGEKMSKSLGNLILVEDLITRYDPMAVRYFLLTHHYRHPWEYERAELDEAVQRRNTLLKRQDSENRGSMEEVRAYLDDDLDTPALLRYLYDKASGQTVREALTLLGLTA